MLVELGVINMFIWLILDQYTILCCSVNNTQTYSVRGALPIRRGLFTSLHARPFH